VAGLVVERELLSAMLVRAPQALINNGADAGLTLFLHRGN
jgi:hypothetical protein